METMSIASTEAESILGAVDPKGRRKLATAWLIEAAGAIGGITLSIISFASGSTNIAAVAALSFGAGLLFEGLGMASCFRRLPAETSENGLTFEWGGASVGKILGGLGGIVVSILVLAGIAAPTLLPVAVLLFSAAFLFTSMVSLLPGTQEIVGAVSFALGLLAAIGFHSLVLIVIALLLLSVVALINDVVSERKVTASGS